MSTAIWWIRRDLRLNDNPALAVVFVIVALVNFTRRDTAYALVILWALAGIYVKHVAVTVVAVPTGITFALVVLTLAVVFFMCRSTLIFANNIRRK